MSLLTAKQRRMPEGAQVQTLVRIGRRALSKAEHLETTMVEYYEHNGEPGEVAQCLADARKLRVKAKSATDEAYQICANSDQLHLRAKARDARALGLHA